MSAYSDPPRNPVSARNSSSLGRDQGQVKAELSHSGTPVQTAGTVVSGHSAIDRASDRFPDKTGYSPLGGTKPWVKDWVRTERSGTPDPLLTLNLQEADVQLFLDQPTEWNGNYHFAAGHGSGNSMIMSGPKATRELRA